MGIRSIVEVLDHAPEGMTSAERLVLLVIAENINDGDPRRETWPGFNGAVLGRRTGLKAEALRKVFQRLAQRGLEARIQIGTGDDGRPLFAVPGVQSKYRLPTLGGNVVPAAGNRFPPKAGTDSRQAGRDSPPTPRSSNSPHSSSLSGGDDETRDEREKSPSDLTTRLETLHGATADEVAAVLAAAARDGIRSVAAWAASEVGHADFTNRLAELRRASQPAPARPTCGQCVNGWLGENEEGRPIYCPTCKPHAVRQAG